MKLINVYFIIYIIIYIFPDTLGLSGYIPEIENDMNELTTSLKMNTKVLKNNFIKLLSPHTNYNINDIPIDGYNNHHKLIITPELESLLYRRSYIINCICTHIFHSFEKCKKYLNSARKLGDSRNTFIFNFR